MKKKMYAQPTMEMLSMDVGKFIAASVDQKYSGTDQGTGEVIIPRGDGTDGDGYLPEGQEIDAKGNSNPGLWDLEDGGW